MLLFVLLCVLWVYVGDSVNYKVDILPQTYKNGNIHTTLGHDEALSEGKLDVSKSITKSVKLSIKQGLLMNQVLNVYGLDSAKDKLCRKHIKEFRDGLRALEPWALQSKYLSLLLVLSRHFDS